MDHRSRRECTPQEARRLSKKITDPENQWLRELRDILLELEASNADGFLPVWSEWPEHILRHHSDCPEAAMS